MKIIRNEVLPASAMPDTYVVGETTYLIRYNSGATASWNRELVHGSGDSNWSDAGLMHWLNSTGPTDGYLKTLSSNAQNMIAKTKYYLGNFNNATGNTIKSYENEKNGNIWGGNSATWTGEIGLMYPSDYGFSADSSYWSSTKLYSYYGGAMNTSWLYKEANHTDGEWLLSPADNSSYYVSYWTKDGKVNYDVANGYSDMVRPTLYLKSEVQITGEGTGELTSPYKLSGN